MTAIVLVHGAWGGSYGFKKVRPLLYAAGHEAFTPSLTGIGERSHLTNQSIGLSTHVQDVVNAVTYEDLEDIILLGFSYGGMVVTGALDFIGDRVKHLVYLDAFIPESGQSLYSLTGAGPVEPMVDPRTSWLLPAIPREASTPEETEWNNARRSMQPIKTFTDPVQLRKPVDEWDFSRTYIKATSDPAEKPDSAFWQMARRAGASDRWSYQEVATNHLVAINRPEELVNILLNIADGAG